MADVCNCVTALNLQRRIAQLECEVERERNLTSDAIDAKYSLIRELESAQKRIAELEAQ